MVTDGNDRMTQVNAGRAYARVQLAATAQGLALQPLQQALEEYAEQAMPYADVRALLGAPLATQTVQMWARVGYGPPCRSAPRRGVAAQLSIETLRQEFISSRAVCRRGAPNRVAIAE